MQRRDDPRGAAAESGATQPGATQPGATEPPLTKPTLTDAAARAGGPGTIAPAAASEPPPNWVLTLWTMVGIQVVMSIAFTILAPIVPLFLPDLGVRRPDMVDLWAGILASVTSLVGTFAAPVWGRLADRYGRKLMVLRSSIGIAVFTGLMGIAQTVWHMLAFRMAMGLFAGFNSAAIALVASQVPDQRLGYALGWLSTGQLVGALIGPVVGGVLADVTDSYRAPFFFAAALSVVAFLLAWWLVPERFVAPPPSGGRHSRSIPAAMALFRATPGLAALMLVLLLAQFAVQAVQPVVTLFVQSLTGPVPQVATLAGVAFSVTGLADVIASPFLGKRSDVLGYRRVLIISLFGAAAATLPQAFAHSYWTFVAERFGVGCFVGGILPTANALVGRMVSASSRGFVYGLSSSASFLGIALGPLTGGVVAASAGLRWVFVVTALLLAVNLVWVRFAVPADS
ncbi:MAG: MFS transporter [Rhodospirillales bacterium]|nr:MFS transporter [Rhodospirillales bacterium]